MDKFEQAEIGRNIEAHGRHIYAVDGGGAVPRWLYTIGMTERIGCELIFGGGAIVSNLDAKNILNAVCDQLVTESGGAPIERNSMSTRIDLDSGRFDLVTVHDSWDAELTLCAREYYHLGEIMALQIVPTGNLLSIDVPRLHEKYDPNKVGSWKWLTEEWNYPVAIGSRVVTNVECLRGNPVTEIVRWEDECWEAFSGHGPDVLPEEARDVALGVLIGHDPSIEAALKLGVGGGLWRSNLADPWHDWKRSS